MKLPKENPGKTHGDIPRQWNEQILCSTASQVPEGNIELGTQVHSKDLAKQVEDVFTRLAFSKVFEEVI